MDKNTAIRCGAIVRLLYHDNGKIDNPNFFNIRQLLDSNSGSESQFKDDMHNLVVNGIVNNNMPYGADADEETKFEISDIAWFGITYYLSSNYQTLIKFDEDKRALDEIFSNGIF